MKKLKSWMLYAVMIVPVTASYIAIRELLIAQEPYDKEVIISNLTLNYVLFALVVGALAPFYLRKKFFPRAPTIVVVPIAIMIGLILILMFKLLGMDMRF